MNLKFLRNCKIVEGLTASCKKPFNVCQDCSNWSGATRKIEFNSRCAKVAGSEDGKIVLVMQSKLELGSKDKNVKEAAFTVLLLFSENDIHVKEIIGMSVGDMIQGYYFKLDTDGYSLLKEYTVK